jgi:hypothetical protein
MPMPDGLADAAAREFPQARDQGPRGTCASFATTAAHEHACGPQRLSEEHAFWLGRQAAPAGTSGAAVADILRGLHRQGQFTADGWPYGEPAPAGPGGGAGDGRCPLPGWEELPDCSFGTVRETVDAGRPVVLTLAFAPAVWFNARQGWLEHDGGAPVVGAHAVLGVAVTEGPTTPAVLVRNSWGTAWGRAGYAWAPAALLDAHGLAAHRVAERRAA